MAKPFPPIEVTQTAAKAGGLQHVSVFLAQALAGVALERAVAPAPGQQRPDAADPALRAK